MVTVVELNQLFYFEEKKLLVLLKDSLIGDVLIVEMVTCLFLALEVFQDVINDVFVLKLYDQALP